MSQQKEIKVGILGATGTFIPLAWSFPVHWLMQRRPPSAYRSPRFEAGGKHQPDHTSPARALLSLTGSHCPYPVYSDSSVAVVDAIDMLTY